MTACPLQPKMRSQCQSEFCCAAETGPSLSACDTSKSAQRMFANTAITSSTCFDMNTVCCTSAQLQVDRKQFLQWVPQKGAGLLLGMKLLSPQTSACQLIACPAQPLMGSKCQAEPTQALWMSTAQVGLSPMSVLSPPVVW